MTSQILIHDDVLQACDVNQLKHPHPNCKTVELVPSPRSDGRALFEIEEKMKKLMKTK